MNGIYIKAHIIDVPYHADHEYTYYVSESKSSEVRVGSSVSVPFGNGNRQRLAIVTEVNVSAEGQIKEITSVMSNYFSLSPEQLELCRFMKSTTLCTIGEAVKCIIPSALVFKTKEAYAIQGEGEPSKYSEIYDYILKNGEMESKKLQRCFDDAEAGLKYLVKNGFLQRKTFVDEREKSKHETRVSLCISKEEAVDIANGEGKIKLRGKKQGDILKLLCEFSELTDKEIYEETGSSKSTLDALIEKGLVSARKVEISRNPYADIKRLDKPVTLSETQMDAFNTLKDLYLSPEPKAALLYGVTGSGKTSVIKKMIDEVVKKGQGVIVLVPEISLTPQTVAVFCGYYGDRVAVIHSSLSQGERFDTYKKIFDGKADIVVGTRSAIFAPVKNLGMIVIDEEQEHTYKSDTNPKYLAHDIARFRCAKSNALMLLASATPSLNSYYKAQSGAYTLVKMDNRYGDAVLPDVLVVDMRKERQGGNMSPFSLRLAKTLGAALDDDKQSILFLNRRGYHSTISCTQCGDALECPNCSIALTYHSFRKIKEDISPENANEVISKSGVLRCHYCGYKSPVPNKCPHCESESLDYLGLGTQKAEQDIETLFPMAKTLRLDADTTTSKTSYERILGDFRDKKANILIGTQMVTKGHNFPLVTVVGVILADMMLFNTDYRAAERTFSMLTQVIGRAGRAKDHGIAIIQTNAPNEQTIQLAARQDYDAFYQNEILVRKAYKFPPFCDLAVITTSSADEGQLNKISGEIIKDLEAEFTKIGAPVIAYGPFEAPVYKANGRYRKRIIVKCKLNSQIRNVFAKVYFDHSKKSAKDYLSIDFNPSSL